jgi:hypothetical protein
VEPDSEPRTYPGPRRAAGLVSARTAIWLACSVWVLSVAMVVLGILLNLLNNSGPKSDFDFQAVEALTAVTFPTVGALIAARRPRNPIGWIFCVIGLSQATSVFAGQYAVYALFTKPGVLPGGEVTSWLEGWAWAPGLGLVAFLLLLFPEGRLLSRRWRWVAWPAASATALEALLPAVFTWSLRGPQMFEFFGNGDVSRIAGTNAFQALGIALFLTMTVSIFLSAGALIARFRRANGEERQQLQWVTYAGALAVTSLLVDGLIEAIGGSVLLADAVQALQIVVVPCFPIVVGIAILHYRLYNVDLIINRTLVYGALTAVLGSIYFGSVVALQQLFHAFTGETSLAIAALFNPLRCRIQDLIDRRFYRCKYDAEKTLRAFGARLCDEVELDTPNEDLLRVVQGTMQPAHVSLWLRPLSGTGQGTREERTR